MAVEVRQAQTTKPKAPPNPATTRERVLAVARKALKQAELEGGKGSELYQRNASSAKRRFYKVRSDALGEVVGILAGKR